MLRVWKLTHVGQRQTKVRLAQPINGDLLASLDAVFDLCRSFVDARPSIDALLFRTTESKARLLVEQRLHSLLQRHVGQRPVLAGSHVVQTDGLTSGFSAAEHLQVGERVVDGRINQLVQLTQHLTECAGRMCRHNVLHQSIAPRQQVLQICVHLRWQLDVYTELGVGTRRSNLHVIAVESPLQYEQVILVHTQQQLLQRLVHPTVQERKAGLVHLAIDVDVAMHGKIRPRHRAEAHLGLIELVRGEHEVLQRQLGKAVCWRHLDVALLVLEDAALLVLGGHVVTDHSNGHRQVLLEQLTACPGGFGLAQLFHVHTHTIGVLLAGSIVLVPHLASTEPSFDRDLLHLVHVTQQLFQRRTLLGCVRFLGDTPLLTCTISRWRGHLVNGTLLL